MLFAPRCRRAPNEKAVICFCCWLCLLLSHILGVSLPPSACSNPLYRHPPPSSEGGEGAPAPRTDFSSVLSSAGQSLPLFFCNQKKSRKAVKEKFRPLPSRSRVRLPPEGGNKRSTGDGAISNLNRLPRRGPGRIFNIPRMLDRRRHFVPAEVIILITRRKAHAYQGG